MKKCGINICLIFLMLFGGALKSVPSAAEYWEARGDVAAEKKNSAAALVAWLRAERVAGLGSRIRIIQKRLLLPVYAKDSPKKHQSTLALEVARSIVWSIPLILLQFGLLLALFFVAFMARKMGFVWLFKEKYLYLFGLILFGCMVFEHKKIDMDVPGVLLKPQVILTSGPSESFPVVTSLQGPDVISVFETLNGHVKVAKNGFYGWVSQDAVEVV